MIINKRTKYKDILPFLYDKDKVQQLMDKIPLQPLKKEFGLWTCGDFIRILNNDQEFIDKEILGKSRYAVVVLGRLKAFDMLMKNIYKYLNQNSTKVSDEEKQASNGVVFPTMQEQILLKVQQRFYLKSFSEAENVLFVDYMLCVKDESSKQKFELNLNRVYEQKRKLKSKSK